jgi:hypothetical protein
MRSVGYSQPFEPCAMPLTGPGLRDPDPEATDPTVLTPRLTPEFRRRPPGCSPNGRSLPISFPGLVVRGPRDWSPTPNRRGAPPPQGCGLHPAELDGAGAGERRQYRTAARPPPNPLGLGLAAREGDVYGTTCSDHSDSWSWPGRGSIGILASSVVAMPPRHRRTARATGDEMIAAIYACKSTDPATSAP